MPKRTYFQAFYDRAAQREAEAERRRRHRAYTAQSAYYVYQNWNRDMRGNFTRYPYEASRRRVRYVNEPIDWLYLDRVENEVSFVPIRR